MIEVFIQGKLFIEIRDIDIFSSSVVVDFLLRTRVLWRFLFKIPVLCGYIDLNTRICGSARIYAGIVATLVFTSGLEI